MTETASKSKQFDPSQSVTPANPKDGQLWYNSNDNIMRMYDAVRGAWRDISGPSDEDFFLNDGLAAHYKMDDGITDTMADELAAHELDRFGPFPAGSTTGLLNLARTFVGNSAQYYANATDIAAPAAYSVALHIRMDGVGDGPLFLAGWTAGATLKVFELSNNKIDFFDSLGAVVETQTFSADILDETVWKTLVFSCIYGGRWNIFSNGFLLASGVAPAIGVGQALGQVRLGQGLAFTADSMSVYNDRAHDDYFAVTYHNSGSGIAYDDYSIINIRRAPISILAQGIQNNADAIAQNTTDIGNVKQEVIDELEPRIKGIAVDHRNIYWETSSASNVIVRTGTFAQDYLRENEIFVQSDISINIAVDIHDGSSVAPSTDYHVVIFADSTGGITTTTAKFVQDGDYPFSVTPPSGYNIYRRIGTVTTDSGSSFIQGVQAGHTFTFKDEQELAPSLNSSSFQTLNTSPFTPTYARFCSVSCWISVGDNSHRELWYSTSDASGTTGGHRFAYFRVGDAFSSTSYGDLEQWADNIPLDGGGAFAYRTAGGVQAVELHSYWDSLED